MVQCDEQIIKTYNIYSTDKCSIYLTTKHVYIYIPLCTNMLQNVLALTNITHSSIKLDRVGVMVDFTEYIFHK